MKTRILAADRFAPFLKDQRVGDLVLQRKPRPHGSLAIFSLGPFAANVERPQKNLLARKTCRDAAFDYSRVNLLEHSRHAGHHGRANFREIFCDRFNALRISDDRPAIRIQVPDRALEDMRERQVCERDIAAAFQALTSDSCSAHWRSGSYA